jgi:hypothetical protein
VSGARRSTRRSPTLNCATRKGFLVDLNNPEIVPVDTRFPWR